MTYDEWLKELFTNPIEECWQDLKPNEQFYKLPRKEHLEFAIQAFNSESFFSKHDPKCIVQGISFLFSSLGFYLTGDLKSIGSAQVVSLFHSMKNLYRYFDKQLKTNQVTGTEDDVKAAGEEELDYLCGMFWDVILPIEDGIFDIPMAEACL